MPRQRPEIAEVRAVVSALARLGPVSLRRAAEQLGVSTRSLQRELESQGTSYSRLLDEIRFAMARQMLLHSKTTIRGISRRLGYRDASSFSRAFARWAGCSPRAYRAASSPNRDSDGAKWPELANGGPQAGGRWSAAPCAPAISKKQSGETI